MLESLRTVAFVTKDGQFTHYNSTVPVVLLNCNTNSEVSWAYKQRFLRVIATRRYRISRRIQVNRISIKVFASVV